MEAFEIPDLATNRIHVKPIGLINTLGYYGRFSPSWTTQWSRASCLRQTEFLLVEDGPVALVSKMRTSGPPLIGRQAADLVR